MKGGRQERTWTCDRSCHIQVSLIFSSKGCLTSKQSATIVVGEFFLPEVEERAIGRESTASFASLSRFLHGTLERGVDGRILDICLEAT